MTIETKITHGGARLGAGRPEKIHSQLSGAIRTPLAYMLEVMNDANADPLRRDRMAVAAAQYIHAKSDSTGKKDALQAAARKAMSGIFAPGKPPRLATITDFPGK